MAQEQLFKDILQELKDVNGHLSSLLFEVERLRDDVQAQTK